VLTLTAGIAPSAAAATTLQIHAPATVTTPYNFVMPSVPGTGVLKVSSTAGITTATMAAITDADIPNTGITLSDYQPIDPDLTTVAGLTCGTGLVLKSTGTSGSNTLWSCGSDLTGAGSGAGDVDGISAATGCVSATGNDSYACTMTPAITAYANNTRYVIKAGTPNTGPATLQLNSIAGPKAIVKIVNDVKTPLVTGDVQDEMWMGLAYDGTDMILLNPTPNIQNAYNLGGTTPSITVGANGWRIMDLTSPTKAFYLCGDTTCTIYQRRYYDTGNSTWVTETVPTSDMVMTIPSTKNWIVEQSGGADLLKVTEAGVFTAEPATTVDFGSAAITKPSKFGTTPPGSCTTGETFLDTDAAVSAMWLGCSGGTFQVIGGGGGGGTVTAPVTLTPPTADIPNTLTIQNFATTNLLRIGTLIGTPTYGSVYFGPGTPTATNYGIAGDGADLYLNGPTSTNLGSGGVWKVKVVSSGVNVSSISFPENSPDVGLSRVSANVLEVRTATAGQNAPLITGFRDGGTTTVGTGLTIRRQSTGTPAAGLGSSLLYQLNSSSTANQDAARMDAVWTDATHATRSAALVANVVSNGTFVQSGRWLPSGLEVPRLTGVATGTDGTCNTGEYWIRANSSETQWKKCQNGTISALDTFGSGGTPAGSTTQLQYNNSGVFGGVGAATWNGTVLTLTSPAVIGGVDLTPNDTKTCTAGSYSVFADTSETALKGCNNGTAGEIEFVDTPSTLTNKTIDATDATNVLTTTSKVWLPAASCQAGVANLLWDVEATNVPTAVCAPDSLGVQKGVADFEQTPESCLQTTIMLPADFALPLDVRYVWYSPVISGNVAFCSQLISNGDGEVDDVAFPAQASGNCIADTTKPTSLQLNYADDPAVTATGVAAGRLLHIRMCRNVDDTGGVVDDLVGKVRFIGAEFTFRRVQ
jgi:hypothetical protein